MLIYLGHIVVALVQAMLSFYSFWLVWRLLLPWLPGPEHMRERIAPYAYFFTDPFIRPVTKGLRLHSSIVTFFALTLIAALQVSLGNL
jgi:uncharacterized protein YggT (Ycf19 family)